MVYLNGNGMLKVQQDLLDISYLQEWATKLKLTDLLQRAFGEAGIKINS